MNVDRCTDCGGSLPSGAVLGTCASCSFRLALELGGVGGGVFEFGGTSRVRGDYELLDEAGRGGAGVVFRARQRSLDRVVALKVLCAGAFADAHGQERLLAEARTAARLQHPHIVAVHETGVLDGHAYLAMEWVAGRSLAEVARTGAVAPMRAADWLRKVALGMAHAHAAGVWHRDLKPSNILLDDRDEPKLVDFGLAVEADGGDAAGRTGVLCGSPAYMPPERAGAWPDASGAAGDVYGMGAVLYEMVTGRAPFVGSTVGMVLEQVRNVEPLAPRALNPAVPADLENVILKCLRKEPGQRYPTAGALEEDLSAFLAGRPVRARPLGRLARVWRWARRRPLAAGLTAALCLAVLGLATLWVVSDHQVREARDAARERLAESLLESARVMRLAREPGWRDRSLEKIGEARRVSHDVDMVSSMRNEAAAALAEVDFCWRKTKASLMPYEATSEMMVCFDPEFRKLAMWNPETRSVELYSVPDGEMTGSIGAPWPDEVCGFSHDGRYLTLRQGNVMSVWDALHAKVVLDATGGMGFRGFSSGSFAPDGARFARGEAGGHVAVYELDEGMAKRSAGWPIPDGGAVSGLDWSADGKSLVLIMNGQAVAVCDAATGGTRWRRDFREGVSHVAWRNDAGRVCAVTGSGRMAILEGQSGEIVEQLGLPVDGTTTARFSPDGKVLAASGQGMGTRLWDAATLAPLGRFDPVAWHLGFSTSGRRLGTFHHKGEVQFLEQVPPLIGKSWTRPQPSPAHPSLALDGAGTKVAVIEEEGPTIWDSSTGRKLGTAAIPHARQLVAATAGAGFLCADDQAVWSFAQTGGNLRKIHDGAAGAILALPDGGVLVADAGIGRLHRVASSGVVDLEMAEPAARLATDPSGRWIACAGEHAEHVDVLDLLQPGRPSVRLENAGASCAFSSDGSLLLTCGRLPRLWRTSDWQPVAGPALPLHANNRYEMRADLSPDGRWIAATQHDREVHLVEVASGKLLVVLPAFEDGIVADLAFSTDGRILVVASGRGDLRVWPLPALRLKLMELGLDW